MLKKGSLFNTFQIKIEQIKNIQIFSLIMRITKNNIFIFQRDIRNYRLPHTKNTQNVFPEILSKLNTKTDETSFFFIVGVLSHYVSLKFCDNLT